jgi:hypothetical protein
VTISVFLSAFHKVFGWFSVVSFFITVAVVDVACGRREMHSKLLVRKPEGRLGRRWEDIKLTV